MSLSSIPHLSLGTSILTIFLVCLALVMLRGIARMLTGTFILALSGWVGLVTWHHSPELSYQAFGKPVGAILFGLPIVAFGCTFFTLIKFVRFAVTPFEQFRSDERRRTSVISGLLVALVPTLTLFILSAGLLHHFSSVEELRAYATGSESTNRIRVFFLNCKSSLDRIVPASVMHKLDPVTDPARMEIARLVTSRSKTNPPPVIDPETGELYPRAIIVDEPELQNLAREEKYGTLIRHPVLTKALDDPMVQSLLKTVKP